MDMVNSLMTFFMNIVSQIMTMVTGVFNTVVPAAGAGDDKKSAFMKWGLILAGLYVAMQVLRLNIGIGGGGKRK